MIPSELIKELQTSAQQLRIAAKRKSKRKTLLILERLKGLKSILVELLGDFEPKSMEGLQRHLYFIEHYTKKNDFDSCVTDTDDIVERDLPSLFSEITGKKLPGGDAENMDMRPYHSLRLHPRIREASESLFRSKHYAQAILEAYKSLCNYVKERSGIKDIDGQALMAKVFNEERPVLKLNPLRTISEKDEQVGFKFIFMGAMRGIRNPKAHENILQEDPYRTLEYLALASLLAKRVEESPKTRNLPLYK